MKKIFLFIFLFIPVQLILSEEILLEVINDAPAWNYPHRGSGTGINVFRKEIENSAILIKKGEIVKGRTFKYHKETIGGKEYYLNEVIYDNREYTVQADNLAPAFSTKLFDDSWMVSFENLSGIFWIRDCYLSVLLSNNRDAFHEFEYKSIDRYNEFKEKDEYLYEEWYEYTNIGTCLEMNQITIYIGGFVKSGFWITDIININNGYKVTVINPMFGEPYSLFNIFFSNPITFPTAKPSFDLLLIKDGDYLDIFLETTENHLETYCRVNKDIIDELNSLLKNNNCNLSEITWPRRADGSMDYSPFEVLNNVHTEAPSNSQLIDTAYDESQTEFAQHTKESPPIPLLAWIAIAGGALLLSGGVILFVKRRKKR
jgi:hypothetical protein